MIEDKRTGKSSSQPRLLVVEDNRDVARSLALLLQALGAEVRVAHDGAGALAALETYWPAAILIDIGLPGMDGYEVARRIRSAFKDRAVTLAALTGWVGDEHRERAYAAGFDRHLLKPPDVDALRSLLEEAETQ